MRATVAALAVLAASVSAQLASRDWPQFGRAPDFRSFTTTGPKAHPGHAEWTYAAGNRVVASPAVVGGAVYAGSDDGNIFALNATTGEPLWKFATGAPVRSSPAVLADGSVIAGSYSGKVHHVSASGAALGEVTTGYAVYAPVSVANGTAFVGSMDKSWYAIDIKTFTVKFTVKATNVVNSGTAVSADGSMAYFMDYSGIVHGVDTATGAVKWTQSTGAGGAGGSSPVLDGEGGLYIGSWSEKAFKMDAATGVVQWSFDTQGEVESHAAFHDGTLYVSAEESKTVFAIDAADGTQSWAWSGASQELNGSPTLTPTLLFVGSNDPAMFCLERATGKLAFSIPTAANVFASAAVADDGWVYFADNTATLDLIKAQTGALMAIWDACDGDAACARAAAPAAWATLTEGERLGAGPVGHVYAIDPSRHLH